MSATSADKFPQSFPSPHQVLVATWRIALLMEVLMNVQSYLDQLGINYRVMHHPIAYTAQDLAAAEHVRGNKVIKPVIVRADGEFVMCALPAPYKIDLEELKTQLAASDVSIADEQQLSMLFPECDLGAEPPIGRMFNMPTLMDESVMSGDQVIFQAGTHEDAVMMSLADYRRAAMPEVAHFGRHM
jgi:Ala-tRNA(Pro) deacylase